MKMTTLAVKLSVVAIIGGVFLNFDECIWSDPANIKNVIVTISYMSVWGFFLFSLVKRKNKKTMIYFLAVWLLTLFISVTAVLAQAHLLELPWFLIPFSALIIPFYGTRYFIDSFMSLFIAIVAISFGMSVVGIILLRRFNSVAKKLE
jgi:hypothetical protein